MAKTDKTKGEITAATSRMIASIKRPFAAFRDAFGKLAVSRAELAPKLIRAFEAYRKDTAGSFVSFVALLDPTVPVADREEYRNHPAYQAANYLKRLGGRTDTAGRTAKPMRSNLANMGRVIAVLVGLVSDQEALWKGIEREFGLTTRQVGTLKKVVAASKPLADLKIARPQPVKIIHVDPADAAETVRTVTRAAA